MTDHDQPDPSTRPEDLWLIDRLLAGESGPESAALVSLFEAATGPATPAELSGEATVVAAYADHLAGGTRPAATNASRRIPVLSALKASKLAGLAAVGGIALASTVTAAYAGALPAGLQDFAHHTIGAQAASDDNGDDQGEDGDATDEPTAGDTPTGEETSPEPTSTGPSSTTSASGAVGPDATGPAAFGLCTAWTHGGLATTSVAYRNLVTAAGDEAGIAAYCATITHPGSTKTHATGSPTSHQGGGSPTSHPGGSPTSHPGH